jgi:hypothetical protein
MINMISAGVARHGDSMFHVITRDAVSKLRNYRLTNARSDPIIMTGAILKVCHAIP